MQKRCRRYLWAALLAGGLLATFGITLGQVPVEVDPLTTSGLTVSELEDLMRNPPNQASCAQIIEPDDDLCFLGFCSFECPESPFGLAACFPPVASAGRLRCGAIAICDIANACTSNADCGPREFCARTCCPIPNQCLPRCPEDNP